MQVQVQNLNIYPYTEKFKGNNIVIEPGQSIEMEFFEAQDFLSKYTPLIKRGDNTPDPRYFKMLKIITPNNEYPSTGDANLVLHATGKKAASV